MTLRFILLDGSVNLISGGPKYPWHSGDLFNSPIQNKKNPGPIEQYKQTSYVTQIGRNKEILGGLEPLPTRDFVFPCVHGLLLARKAIWSRIATYKNLGDII